VVGLDGHRICPASEFKRISGYRKFLGTVLKEKEIETSSEAKIEIVASLVRLYAKPIPEKILQENHQKLIQVKLDLEVLAENMEKLQDLLTNDFQTYLLDIGERIDIILSGLMTKLVGNDKVSNEERDEALLKAKIPNGSSLGSCRKIGSRTKRKMQSLCSSQKATSLKELPSRWLKSTKLISWNKTRRSPRQARCCLHS
jgi:hypothetical protein